MVQWKITRNHATGDDKYRRWRGNAYNNKRSHIVLFSSDMMFTIRACAAIDCCVSKSLICTRLDVHKRKSKITTNCHLIHKNKMRKMEKKKKNIYFFSFSKFNSAQALDAVRGNILWLRIALTRPSISHFVDTFFISHHFHRLIKFAFNVNWFLNLAVMSAHCSSFRTKSFRFHLQFHRIIDISIFDITQFLHFVYILFFCLFFSLLVLRRRSAFSRSTRLHHEFILRHLCASWSTKEI